MNIFVAEHHKGHVLCIVRSLDEKTFASISQQCVTVYVCDSETGHCISGPFELRGLDPSDWGIGLDGYISPDVWSDVVLKTPCSTLRH